MPGAACAPPRFLATTVGTLALAIGAVTAIFSVVKTVLPQPLPYPGGDRVVSIAGIALLGIAYAVLARLLTDQWVPGWAAPFVAILFVGGVQLIALGVIGKYVGRLFMQSKARPMYVTAELLGSESHGVRNEDQIPRAVSAWSGAGRR